MNGLDEDLGEDGEIKELEDDKFQFKNSDSPPSNKDHLEIQEGEGGMSAWAQLADPSPNPGDDVSDDKSERMLAINQLNLTETTNNNNANGAAPTVYKPFNAVEEANATASEGEGQQNS